MTREQEAEVDRLAAVHGRVCVDAGYRDGWVRLTVPGGACWRVYPDGRAVAQLPNHSVNWRQ